MSWFCQIGSKWYVCFSLKLLFHLIPHHLILVQVQQLFVDLDVFPLLLVLRNDTDLECRRLALEAFLSVLENRDVQRQMETNEEVVNTVLALSKFGITPQVKQRATKVLVAFAHSTIRRKSERTVEGTSSKGPTLFLANPLPTPGQEKKASPTIDSKSTSKNANAIDAPGQSDSTKINPQASSSAEEALKDVNSPMNKR